MTFGWTSSLAASLGSVVERLEIQYILLCLFVAIPRRVSYDDQLIRLSIAAVLHQISKTLM